MCATSKRAQRERPARSVDHQRDLTEIPDSVAPDSFSLEAAKLTRLVIAQSGGCNQIE
jgi:hypothetical protein